MSPTKSHQDLRRQAGSPNEGAIASKPSAPRAWSGGANPITQKANGPSSVNGLANGHVQERGSTDRSASQDPEKLAHDRLLFLYSSLIGLDVSLTLKNNERFAGIFSGASSQPSEPRYLLKMVRKLASQEAPRVNGAGASTDDLVGEGDDHAMAFNLSDVVDLVATSVQLGTSSTRAANGSAFRTDVEISGNRLAAERVLQRWEPGPNDNMDMSLGTEDSLGSGSWDQFAVNEKLYNVRSDYDEGLYTTAIDRSNPQYKQIAEKADRLAREIESQAGGSRRQETQGDPGLDEEDKYSGVRRDGPTLNKNGPNAYVPPSRRQISSKPTISGAPFDPAIVSSQLSKQEAAQVADSAPRVPNDRGAGTPDITTASGTISLKDAVSRDLNAAMTNGAAGKAAVPRLPSVAEPGASTSTAADNGANIMRNLTNDFKKFSADEKLRVQHQQRQNQQQKARDARQEKSVKLNDLKKFSQNFKLTSRVPEDLVPILAKSREKQEEIKAKAEQQARDKEDRRAQGIATPPSAGQSDATTGSSRAAPANELSVETAPNMSGRTRSQQTGRAANGPAPTVRGQSIFQQRGQQSFRQGAPGAVPPPIPIPQPIPQPKAEPVLSPTSATSLRFNAKAMEFKPNPGASTFTPTGPPTEAPSSKRPSVVSPPPKSAAGTPAADFFGSSTKKSKFAEGDWASTTDKYFSTVKWLYDQTDEQKRTQYATNGGIPQGYRTAPVWDTTDANIERSYVDMFAKSIHQQPPSPMHGGPNGAMPHQHQLPLHLQNGAPHMQQNPSFYRHQSHPNMGHDDQRMPYSSGSSVQPSPRMGQPHMAFTNQPHAPMPGYPYMPAGGMSPGIPMRPMPAGGYMTPQGTPMGGHMMVPQGSNGPYMQHPGQMPGYPSPAPSHVQPQFGGQMGQMMPGGYAGSPRGVPMSHQGSQQGQGMYVMPGQGQGPMMMMMPQHGGPGAMRYGQPQFGQGPYGMQQRTMSNGGYGQHLTPRQHHAMPHQGGPPPMHPSMSSQGEDQR